MDSRAEVIIIDGSSYEKFERTFTKTGEIKDVKSKFIEVLPLRDIDAMIESVHERVSHVTNSHVFVRLVGKQYKINHYQTPEGKEYFRELHTFKTDETANEQYAFHDCSWSEFFEDFAPDANCHYFFVSPETFENDYDFFNYLGLPCVDNYYVCHGVKRLTEIRKARCPLNIFSGCSVEDSFDTCGNPVHIDQDAISWLIEYGVTQTEFLKAAGIPTKERFIQNPIPSWVLNTESYFMKGVIVEYELYPTVKIVLPPGQEEEESDHNSSNYNNAVSKKYYIGKTIQEKFLESANYRLNIFDHMCRVLCQYGILNGKIKEVLNHQEIDFKLLLR